MRPTQQGPQRDQRRHEAGKKRMDHRATELVVCDAARGEDLARVGAGIPSTRAARESGCGDDAVAAGEALEGGAVCEARSPHAHILDESEIAHLAGSGQGSGRQTGIAGEKDEGTAVLQCPPGKSDAASRCGRVSEASATWCATRSVTNLPAALSSFGLMQRM